MSGQLQHQVLVALYEYICLIITMYWYIIYYSLTVLWLKIKWRPFGCSWSFYLSIHHGFTTELGKHRAVHAYTVPTDIFIIWWNRRGFKTFFLIDTSFNIAWVQSYGLAKLGKNDTFNDKILYHMYQHSWGHL